MYSLMLYTMVLSAGKPHIVLMSNYNEALDLLECQHMPHISLKSDSQMALLLTDTLTHTYLFQHQKLVLLNYK